MDTTSRRWLTHLALAVAFALPALAQEAHVGNLTGHAASGKKLYRRFCIGCHGPLGDGNGENAQWIDPKPRDFTAATFKCRSTPTGTLPTDEDLYNSVGRGFTTLNMPPWEALTDQNRIDLVAYIKTFLPALEVRETPAIRSPFRRSQPSPCRASLTARSCSRRWSAGNVTASREG